MSASSSSSSVAGSIPKGPQVFINFRGKELRTNFLDYLANALKEAKINVFIDEHLEPGRELKDLLLVKIEESKVALAIISKEYSNSDWCLDELVKIKECVDKGTLTGIPIFYKVEPAEVADLLGTFGDNFTNLKLLKHPDQVKTQKWEEALKWITQIKGLELEETSRKSERVFINEIVAEVKRAVLKYIAKNEEQIPNSFEAVQIRQYEGLPSESVPIQPHINSQGLFLSVRSEELTISSSRNAMYWTFMSISESSNEAAFEIAQMRSCYYLAIRGKYDTTKLTMGTRYKVVFVVKVEDTMSKWSHPVKVELMVQDMPLQEGKLEFVDLVKNEWVEIEAGVFVAEPGQGEIIFYLYEKSTQEKTGLQFKGAIIRPME